MQSRYFMSVSLHHGYGGAMRVHLFQNGEGVEAECPELIIFSFFPLSLQDITDRKHQRVQHCKALFRFLSAPAYGLRVNFEKI
ncbi:hypothetical protein PanWU01x14_013170 [Parasponia andersonii]|uniref:Uncharacterized protein n=1 Tax=Parasponia andersonii TaxID=3476 RepID=A0A2P5E0Y9_PARAD|nr:hypothetical protein PanWU01x14_013170 [Parasponia andersonii]